jgi:hypothetical protein
MTEESDFEPLYGQELSPFHVLQTGFGIHLASYATGIGEWISSRE